MCTSCHLSPPGRLAQTSGGSWLDRMLALRPFRVQRRRHRSADRASRRAEPRTGASRCKPLDRRMGPHRVQHRGQGRARVGDAARSTRRLVLADRRHGRSGAVRVGLIRRPALLRSRSVRAPWTQVHWPSRVDRQPAAGGSSGLGQDGCASAEFERPDSRRPHTRVSSTPPATDGRPLDVPGRGGVLGIDHLEYRLADPAFRERLLPFLEELLYRRHCRVWIAATRDPVDQLRESNATVDLDRWRRLLQSFRKETVGFCNAPDPARVAAVSALVDARHEGGGRGLKALILPECSLAPQLLSIAEDVIGRLPQGRRAVARRRAVRARRRRRAVLSGGVDRLFEGRAARAAPARRRGRGRPAQPRRSSPSFCAPGWSGAIRPSAS